VTKQNRQTLVIIFVFVVLAFLFQAVFLIRR